MKAVFALLVLLITISCGCAANSHYTFRFDPDTTPDEKRIAVAAMQAWNADGTTVDECKMHEDPNGEWRISFLDDPATPEEAAKYPGETINGLTCKNRKSDTDCPGAKWIRIRRGLETNYSFVVAEHELGHAIGLKHVADANALMYARATNPGFAQADMDECLRVGACGSIVVEVAP